MIIHINTDMGVISPESLSEIIHKCSWPYHQFACIHIFQMEFLSELLSHVLHSWASWVVFFSIKKGFIFDNVLMWEGVCADECWWRLEGGLAHLQLELQVLVSLVV